MLFTLAVLKSCSRRRDLEKKKRSTKIKILNKIRHPVNFFTILVILEYIYKFINTGKKKQNNEMFPVEWNISLFSKILSVIKGSRAH